MKKSGSRPCPCQGGTLMRFVQPLILAQLEQGPDHGYSIVQKISHTRLWKNESPDAAGVYRVLREMEERGLVTAHLEQDCRAGLGKRVFSITEEGRNCRSSWLRTLRSYRRGVDEVISMLERPGPSSYETIKLRQE